MSEYNEQYNSADYVAPIGVARTAVNWLGAIASIALVVGLIYWVFQLGTRNPNEIPIIRAMEGPARSQPDNPGGTQVSHQGLAVNAVQSNGIAQTPAQTVTLAPASQDLTQEDVSQNQLKIIKPVLRTETNSIVDNAESDKQIASLNPSTTTQDQSLMVEDIVIVEPEKQVVVSSPYAPIKSSIPVRRPGNFDARIKETTAITANPPKDVAITTENIPVGTRLVQLGAYDSQSIALKEWEKISAKHQDLLSDKKRVVQSAESGGRVFYRLRALGFNSVEDSRNLCSALLARGTPCIPVAAR